LSRGFFNGPHDRGWDVEGVEYRCRWVGVRYDGEVPEPYEAALHLYATYRHRDRERREGGPEAMGNAASSMTTLVPAPASHLVGSLPGALAPSWQMYDVKGVRVAHLDYTYGLNGIHVPAGKPWIVNLIDPSRILEDAHRAREAGVSTPPEQASTGLSAHAR